jgi:hypothetical protein
VVHVLPRALRRQVALLVALAVVAGCGGNERSAGASRGELAWLKALTRWEFRMDRALRELSQELNAVLSGDSPRAGLPERLEPIRSCAEALREDVGRPPARYQPAFELFDRSCGHLERFADELERSLDGNPGEHLVSAGQAQSEAEQLLLAARRAVETRLTARRPLPRAGGTDQRSRIEPLFSRVASVIVGREVEVVCWSRKEWPDVVQEWGAYMGNTDFGAFAHYDDDRAYLGPEVCDPLVDLAYRDRRPKTGEAREHAASAVSVLAHEAGHLFAASAGEAETECYGMQDMRRVGRLLGLDAAYAGSLAEYYWQNVYETLPDGYVSPLCADGGPWDRNDNSSVWP